MAFQPLPGEPNAASAVSRMSGPADVSPTRAQVKLDPWFRVSVDQQRAQKPFLLPGVFLCKRTKAWIFLTQENRSVQKLGVEGLPVPPGGRENGLPLQVSPVPASLRRKPISCQHPGGHLGHGPARPALRCSAGRAVSATRPHPATPTTKAWRLACIPQPGPHVTCQLLGCLPML